jgi:hypothetical protein
MDCQQQAEREREREREREVEVQQSNFIIIFCVVYNNMLQTSLFVVKQITCNVSHVQ